MYKNRKKNGTKLKDVSKGENIKCELYGQKNGIRKDDG